MIRVPRLEKAVKAGTGALFLLRNVNLVVEQGDFLTLMGPSGAGKSTLLAVLGMLDGGLDRASTSSTGSAWTGCPPRTARPSPGGTWASSSSATTSWTT